MKRLDHTREKPERVSEVSRRDFFKATGAAVLVAALQGGIVGSVLLPRTAYAQTREVGGRQVNEIQLDRTLAELARDTAQYQTHEHLPSSSNNYTYSHDIIVPNEVTFLVSVQTRGSNKLLAVTFPKERETDPNARGAGLRGVDITDFLSFARRVAGQDITKVRFILERGTFQYNGRQTDYTTAYIFPLDSNGNMITRLGNGEYLVYTASYYANVVTAEANVIIEPNNRDTIARR
ncbi:MAG: twin-arginine translocation signal domain-containing protein [Candidatus Micrarchaeota archaeon]